MRYFEMKSSRLTILLSRWLASCGDLESSLVLKRTVATTHASLSGESRPSVQDAPVVKDYLIREVSGGPTMSYHLDKS